MCLYFLIMEQIITPTKSIRRTKWAKEYKRDDAGTYEEAIKLASRPVVEVDILKIVYERQLLWAVVTDNDFWLDSPSTEKEARALCERMGWQVIGLPPAKVSQPYPRPAASKSRHENFKHLQRASAV
jgi:hypothetical protein